MVHETVDFICLLDMLKDLIHCKSCSVMPWKDQLYALHGNVLLFKSFLHSIKSSNSYSTNYNDGLEDSEKNKQIRILLRNLSFLSNYFYSDNEQIDIEQVKVSLISAQVVTFKMACECLLFRYGKFGWWKEFSDTKERVDSLTRVWILRGLVMLRDGCDTSLIEGLVKDHGNCTQTDLLTVKSVDPNTMNDQFENLYEVVSSLLPLLVKQCELIKECDESSEVKAWFQSLFLSNIGSVICPCFGKGMEGYDMYREMEGYDMYRELSDLVKKMDCVKEETISILYSVALDRIGQESPKIYQPGYFNILIRKWKELWDCEANVVMDRKNQFQMIHENLVLFGSFIDKVASNSSRDDESQTLCNSVMNVGCMAEYLIDLFALECCPVWLKCLWISECMERCEVLKAALMEANREKAMTKEINCAVMDMSEVSSQALVVPTTDVVVGFKVEMQLIRKRIAGHLKKLDVISIIGMPGLGKTTLAKKVYDDPYVVSYFDVRAWCCVSQEYNKKHLFLTILDHIIGLTDLIRRKSETDLFLMVHQQLMGRRYLIILDDVWEIDAFMELKRFFPDDHIGSRIILTSRNNILGLQAKCYSDPIEPGLLNDELSWDLLERKVYPGGKCPLELCQIGKEIAQKCRGLPLAVVLVGGILAKSVLERDFWEQVATNLSSFIARDSESQFMAALELSYKFLPDYLKPLFLYLGAFPEDKEIPIDKLTWLWIAEGFVQKTELRSLEIQAETSLMDLIDRNLVMVAKRRSDGRVKACHVHDLLRELCLIKAREENFMEQIHACDEFPDSILYQRRLSIFMKRNNGYTQNSSTPLIKHKYLPILSVTPPLRTCLFFNMYKGQQLLEVVANPDFSFLKLLRILHSERNTVACAVCDDIMKLVHLRYISIRAFWESIPSSISSLSNLETLIIKGVRGEILVPDSIWRMVKLRHVHINDRATFSNDGMDSPKLENLGTLSTPVITFGGEKYLARKVPNLQKLRCVLVNSSNYRYRKFHALASLDKLESLKMLYYGGVKWSGQFKLPLTLKKLSLSKFRLRWSHISIFQTLPNLEVLKLRSGAVHDEFWDIGDEDEFTNLKFLKLDNLNIRRWTAASENFPSLEKVVIERCKQLVEIPSSLGDINSLQKIEVLWCSHNAAKMAKEIEEEQAGFGNELLKVHIYPATGGLVSQSYC